MASQQKGKKRSAGKHAVQYARQFDITKHNKIIRLASHVGRLMHTEGQMVRPGGNVHCRDGKAEQVMRALSILDMRTALSIAKKRNNLKAIRALEWIAY